MNEDDELSLILEQPSGGEPLPVLSLEPPEGEEPVKVATPRKPKARKKREKKVKLDFEEPPPKPAPREERPPDTPSQDVSQDVVEIRLDLTAPNTEVSPAIQSVIEEFESYGFKLQALVFVLKAA